MWIIFIKIYLILLVGVSILGFMQVKYFDSPTKVLLAYICITSISETAAFLLAINQKNNLWLYHIYGPMQLSLLCVFFNNTIASFKKHKIGFVILSVGIVYSIVNSIFVQQLSVFNTYFIVVESILIIGITLYYFYSFLNGAQVYKNHTTPHFWVACFFLLFWSFTFFRWLTALAMPQIIDNNIMAIQIMMWSINMITYTGFGIVFLYYRKLQPVE